MPSGESDRPVPAEKRSHRKPGIQQAVLPAPSLLRRPRQPNVLLLISDEHSAQVARCYGNPLVRTPALDRIAAEGITFEDCYCNSPLCVPSRLALTAGKYVSRTGVWNNQCWLPTADYPSIARVMAAAGYDAILCGRMHYDCTRRYGFTEISGVGNDGYRTGRGERRRPDDLSGTDGVSSRFEQFRTGWSGVLAHDTHVRETACRYLRTRSTAGRPFFMVVGFLAPHFPLIVPEVYWNAYRGRVPMPQIPSGHVESLPLNYRHLRAAFRIEHVPQSVVCRGRELYYGLAQWLDEQLDAVLDALAESGLAEDTIVIYTSDHGENLGEHGMWWKNCMFEQAARVPLLVSWPRRWAGGQRRRGACSLVDLVQSVAEIGGTLAPPDWDGDSMCRWMDDATTAWKDMAVSEYYGHNIASGFAMLRRGPYKYVYHTRADRYHPPERELYDLQSDPGEFHNLAQRADQQERTKSMHQMLVAELGEDPEESESRCRRELTAGYRPT